MSDAHAVSPSPPSVWRLLEQAMSARAEQESWDYRLCSIKRLAQDQAAIRIKHGGDIDIYVARLHRTERDAQSEVVAKSALYSLVTGAPLYSAKGAHWARLWYSQEIEEQQDSLATPEDSCGVKDMSRWTPDQLADDILERNATDDWLILRKRILSAEDIGFSVELSSRLAPRLIELAILHRDNNDPQDKPVVWSAIRTGASMLRPDEADQLRPLLEPGHHIETSLVAVKMLGRIFEAQPPAAIDQYRELADKVSGIANSLLNPYVVASSQSAAMAQLAIYALVTLASSHATRITEAVHKLGLPWFARQTAHDLRQLRERWSDRSTAKPEAALGLLEQVIRDLAGN